MLVVLGDVGQHLQDHEQQRAEHQRGYRDNDVPLGGRNLMSGGFGGRLVDFAGMRENIHDIHDSILSPLPGGPAILNVVKTVPKSLIIAALAGFVAGCLWLLAVRFFLAVNTETHYHANFALYIDGQKDEFDNFTFYEEVQSCSGDQLDNPRARAHMHDRINHVVHVHDNAVTWGHFFANLGYGLTNTALKTDNGVFVDGVEGKELRFLVNGEEVQTVANRVIGDQDVLLVNYGSEDSDELVRRYDDILKDADEFNQRTDPSSCSGGRPLTFGERFRQALGF